MLKRWRDCLIGALAEPSQLLVRLHPVISRISQ